MFFTQQGQGGSVVFLPRTRRGKTATKWNEQELLGQIFFSRKQKKRASSVFYCAKERQRTQFWLAKSEWQRADNLRYVFPINYFPCRYWGEVEKPQLMNSTINSSETLFLFFPNAFVKLAFQTLFYKSLEYSILKIRRRMLRSQHTAGCIFILDHVLAPYW